MLFQEFCSLLRTHTQELKASTLHGHKREEVQSVNHLQHKSSWKDIHRADSTRAVGVGNLSIQESHLYQIF